MQGSLYNNPLFAQSLGTLVESFIGNPASEAQTQLMSSEALLNNQTAQYRDAIGDTGLQGDLASMMIRALQAGPDYSRYAPEIGQAAMGFENAGQGSLGNAVSQAIMQQAAMAQAEHAQSQQPAAQPAAQPMAQPMAQPAPQPISTTLPLITPQAPAVDPVMEISIINQAREAIAMGKDPNAVMARLQQLGVSPERL